MIYKKKYTKLYSDLETTVWEEWREQDKTEAWSCAFVGKTAEDPVVKTSLWEALKWIKKQPGNLIIYYHNLKFDGFFWVDYFERYKHFKLGTWKYKKDVSSIPEERLKPVDKLLNGEYTYRISAKGQWYAIYIKHHNRYIEMRDSLKLLPFKLGQIGEAFQTEHKKLDMDYTGHIRSGEAITDDEMNYIKNDVYVLKEGLEIMEAEGHDRLTIGSCCLEEFKRIFGKKEFKETFPNQFQVKLSEEFFESNGTYPEQKPLYGSNVGSYILRGYKGAFCDVGEGKDKQVLYNGYTLDVTSLYPFVMHSMSGNYYPIGKPKAFKTTPTTDINKLLANNRFYYFFRFECTFNVKKEHIPFVQIKGDYRYSPTEHLKTSDIWDIKDKKYKRYVMRDGKPVLNKVILTMCEDELKLFFEQYDVRDFKLLDGIFYYKEIGLFDEYINKWVEIKNNEKGVKRTIAKLFLNNLYGKFATTPDSSYKILRMGPDKVLHYKVVEEYEKEPGYIPVGAAVTAKARAYTIRAAQANYNNFNYADTDSLHLSGSPKDAKGVMIASNTLGAWKLESTWSEAYFTRQKTYIEKTGENQYNIVCAGMPDRCKDLLRLTLIDKESQAYKEIKASLKKLDKDEEEFIKETHTIKDFDVGLTVPGKLKPKIIMGGILLEKETYEMRGEEDAKKMLAKLGLE